MKIEGRCANCKKPVGIDTDKMEVVEMIKPLENTTASTANQQTVQLQEPTPIEKIVEKEVIKSVPSSDQPYYECKDCDNMHKNPNYKIKPSQKCSNCGSLNRPKAKGCKNCGNIEFDEIDNDELNELGVPDPEITESEHEHKPAE